MINETLNNSVMNTKSIITDSAVNLPNDMLISLQTRPKDEIRQVTSGINRLFYLLLFFILLISLVVVINELNSHIPKKETDIERFERIARKIQNGENITKEEQTEFCQLLKSVKDFTIDNCETLDLLNLKEILQFIDAINSISPNRIHHILQEHHQWKICLINRYGKMLNKLFY